VGQHLQPHFLLALPGQFLQLIGDVPGSPVLGPEQVDAPQAEQHRGELPRKADLLAELTGPPVGALHVGCRVSVDCVLCLTQRRQQ